MTTYYLDFEGGNDANAGTSFALRWKTITSGATAARIAAGDTIRIMGSPDPTLVGNATWTQYSKTITLAAAVTANISDGEAVWSGSASVTTTASASTFKEGAKSAQLAIAAAFTTGKVAYIATGTLDLSAYQQVSFWIQNSVPLASASVMRLCLCSDTAGATPVHNIPVPAIASTSQWVPITVDLGANMSSAIQSVALYQDVDIGAVSINLDNIIACKASSDPASLTLTSLIGKVCNLSWTASTTYATGDERKPTQPNRNGFRYKATTGGTTGATEPIWPQEVGVTVTDGTVTWSCVGLEDTWYGIQSINGTTVKLDNHTNCSGNAGRGYAGATETVATYKRETSKLTMQATAATFPNTTQKAGTDAAPIVYSGGWNRTDMSTQTGETWLDGQNGFGYLLNNSSIFNTFINFNSTRMNVGGPILANGNKAFYCHWNNHTSGALDAISGGSAVFVTGTCSNNNAVNGNNFTAASGATVFASSAESNLSSGMATGAGSAFLLVATNYSVRNNGAYGISHQSIIDAQLAYGVTGNNATAAYQMNNTNKLTLLNCISPEATFVSGLRTLTGAYVYSQKHNQTADNHIITTDSGSITSAIDQRHTLSGIAWKFRPTGTSRNSAYPLKLSVAKIACQANSPVSVAIWTRRDNANIKGQLFLAGGQIAGAPKDVAIDCQPTVNVWEASSTLTFTPTESGVVEILFKVWDGVGTANNFWIDDLAVS